MTEVPIKKKPVHLCAEQINGLISIMIGTFVMKESNFSLLSNFYKPFYNLYLTTPNCTFQIQTIKYRTIKLSNYQTIKIPE